MQQTRAFTVTYDDGRNVAMAALARPARLAEPGDVYEATVPFSTLGGVEYVPGDRFLVLERTHFRPFHRTSSLGNLIIRCKAKTSVWSEFEGGIADGQFLLVSPESVER